MTAAWLTALAIAAVAFYYLGFLTGRDAAERTADYTIASLRESVVRLERDRDVLRDHLGRSRYLTTDEARPE